MRTLWKHKEPKYGFRVQIGPLCMFSVGQECTQTPLRASAWPLHENTVLEEEQRLIQQESPFHGALSLRVGDRMLVVCGEDVMVWVLPS
jgi:hypothetical protein